MNIARTKLHRIWRQMRYRCRNPNAPEYKNYGGRGIKVCERWEVFENFKEDMGEPPSRAHTLDRRDVNAGYSKGNCKWATWTEQHRNKRNNRLLTAFGKTQCMTAWAEEFKLPVSTLKNRLYRAKMCPEDALRAPLYAKQRGVQ